MLAAVDGIVGETDTVLRLVLTADHGTVLILVMIIWNMVLMVICLNL